MYKRIPCFFRPVQIPAVLCLLLLSTVVCGQVPDSLRKRFTYQQTIRLYVVDSSFVKNKTRVERVTYLSTDSFVVSAYVVRPVEMPAKVPLLIFQHWGEGDKAEFLEEAVSFAVKGFVCILPDGPWLCPNTPINSFKRQGYEMYRQCVMNARVAVDLCGQHFPLDTTNIFFIGHSFGCNTGAILSGVERRIDHFVFMAGAPSTTKNITDSKFPDFVEWRQSDPALFSAWVNKVKLLDALHYLPYKTKPCLVQVATRDEYISSEENKQFITLTPSPKVVKQYDATHGLNTQAAEDRMAWILQQVTGKK